MPRNPRPAWRGIGGRLAAESAAGIRRNTQQIQQSSLLEQPLKPLEKPECAFGYRYTSAGNGHERIIHDWEVQEAHRQYKRRYGDQAIEKLVGEYGGHIPTRNLHFIMGTMAAHPRTFIVIGLLRSGFDPAELAKQSDLFK